MADSAEGSGRARKRDNTPLAARPDLLSRIHPDDRERASRLSAGSPEIVRWICKPHGHILPAQIRARAKQGAECAYCTNKKILVGFNDAATRAPDLVAEWHPDKNDDKTLADFTYGSTVVGWWLCANGHEWQAQIRHRVGTHERPGTGCGDCKGLRRYNTLADGTVAVANGKSLLAAWPDATTWWNQDNPAQPEAVHQNDGEVEYGFTCPEGHSFRATAKTMSARKERCHTCTGREVVSGINTLDVTHPAYAAEWDEELSGLPASRVTWANRKVFHWRCSLGHSYTAPVRNRTVNGTGCSYCEGRAVQPGFNDVATVYPDLIPDWDDERDPATVFKHATDYVNWKCEHGHRWPAQVVERAVGGTGCPFCAGQRVEVGVNDLATTDPEIAAQWDIDRNDDLTPQEVTIGSGRAVWWHIEACGHTWKAQVRNRISPACSPCTRGVAIAGVNDVATTHPGITAYFDQVANPGVNLTERRAGSGTSVNWSCPTCTHRWTDQIRRFAAFDEPCPRCSGREPTPGVNDAATLYPHLLAEVDEDVQPASILVGMTAHNGARIAWKCYKGHKWDTRLNDRVHYNTGCPDCMAASWTSRGEDEVAAYIESLGLEVQRGVWLRPGGQRHNFDIYIPASNTYIEYNSLYFHSEATGKDGGYHAAKLRAAKEAGAAMLTVWEDDWLHKQEIVKRYLAHKLGHSTQPTVYARKTSVALVETTESERFLHEHHIQGPVNAGLRFALLDPNHKIVAVMLIRIEGAEATIVRYATSLLVPGGFTKLLSHVREHLRENAPGVVRIKTFSDNLISDGTLYAAAGFADDGQVPPDYAYFRGRSPRLHKFNLRLARFKKDPTLIYEEGKSERELAVINGFHRVWDAGKTRWMLPLQDEPADLQGYSNNTATVPNR